jgi:hypothetical protein
MPSRITIPLQGWEVCGPASVVPHDRQMPRREAIPMFIRTVRFIACGMLEFEHGMPQ